MLGLIPDPVGRTKRLLKEAENDLLTAEGNLEVAYAFVNAYRSRVARLRESLTKTAPETASWSKSVLETKP